METQHSRWKVYGEFGEGPGEVRDDRRITQGRRASWCADPGHARSAPDRAHLLTPLLSLPHPETGPEAWKKGCSGLENSHERGGTGELSSPGTGIKEGTERQEDKGGQFDKCTHFLTAQCGQSCPWVRGMRPQKQPEYEAFYQFNHVDHGNET